MLDSGFNFIKRFEFVFIDINLVFKCCIFYFYNERVKVFYNGGDNRLIMEIFVVVESYFEMKFD